MCIRDSSLGVQSLQPSLLNQMHRHHTSEDVLACIKRIHAHGIHNISIDMIYGLPKQSLAMWEEDLHTIVSSFPIQHISLYGLTIEPHSEFGRQGIQNIDEDIEADMYDLAITLSLIHIFAVAPRFFSTIAQGLLRVPHAKQGKMCIRDRIVPGDNKQEKKENSSDASTDKKQNVPSNGKKIYIYNTHQDEKYQGGKTVMDAAVILAGHLEKKGYKVVLETNDFNAYCNTHGLSLIHI